ncbi:MAG: MBL fold metallo-hydrolase [Desulfuromonadales bacterium]|nr:MBL fold metallo-hydrolase [Desulfuromonadales bacterium]
MTKLGIFLSLLMLLTPLTADAQDVFSYTPVKHASFILQAGATTVYVDPVGDAGEYAAFPPPDLILITHIHKDHLAPELLATLKQDKTTIIGSPTVIEQLGYGTAMGNGEATVAQGISIESIPAYNTTAERLNFHPKGRDNGYLLSKAGARLYISGDTEDIPEMRALQDIDVAFVCMNLPFTMSVEQAASAVNEFKPKIVIPYHYRGKPEMSDIDQFERLVTGSEVSRLKWY